MPELRQDQEEGAAFLVSKERGALFDEPGFGKTAQTIRAMDRLGARRAVIEGPAAAHEAGVWQGEFRKWGQMPRRVLHARDASDLGLWLRGRADVLLLSYEMATRWEDQLSRDLYEVYVADEAHRMKTWQAKRTRAALGTHCDGVPGPGASGGFGRWAGRSWFLTGTPMTKGPADIWTLARYCRATPLTFRNFCDRYFRQHVGAYGTRYTPKEEMLEELGRLIASFSLRRLTKDLPPLWITTLTLDGDTAEVRRLLADYPDLEQAIMDAVDQGGLSFLDADHVATLRRLVGEAKAPVYAKLLVEELQDNPDAKRVVMGWHTKAIAIVRAHLDHAGIEYVLVTGREADADAEQLFQNNPRKRVFLGQLAAAGEALTLTTAADIDLFEPSWSPAQNFQGIKRIHRTGQTEACRARMIALSNSIDERVLKVVERATAAIAKVDSAALSAMGQPQPRPQVFSQAPELAVARQRIVF